MRACVRVCVCVYHQEFTWANFYELSWFAARVSYLLIFPFLAAVVFAVREVRLTRAAVRRSRGRSSRGGGSSSSSSDSSDDDR